ncbi:MAG: aminotransferase class I/II-fold pyridoxal phosphate-dependent enzyme [Sandaracinaceae bacterium]|nr:aminotransferase class I/II-fold pyridoxal phosphate-dependent enzyme [Sandaracinaceae bacterium]MBK7150696.1 aminotransferase class I/II-fold pyridoxal phosphate-dependent enzyme [Sandaracinaceae bacterium]MBK8412598.1 aminotransferase class I/II-fold pyridoxal phosphate-dependent enzyme [Sandaracinaceae bacterium]MBK8590172.1 aminotransferase class I/II-fold pyridoxal phosphate-dependent enzyme [Sandaracinaceae bacterium]
MSSLTPAQSKALVDTLPQLEASYAALKEKGLKLDMTRGKPSNEQLDLANALNTALAETDYKAADGTDGRNYGGLDGLPEMKAIFAELLETTPANVIVGGASSLTMMHDAVVRGLLHGVPDGDGPWVKSKVKFLCPAPGYDRHFSICQHHGIEMIPVEIDASGPDMDAVEKLVASDASIKGMWCVPKYSNPTGETYSAEAVERLAGMKTAAPDFRLFWDNAYAVHDLFDTTDPLVEIIGACAKAGNPNRPIVFASTSKISFAGAGVACLATSAANVADAKKHLGVQSIGPDKMNQLRHVRFFTDAAGVKAHMQKHSALLRPKFAAVDQIFERELGGTGLATWTKPRGGYFVSLDTLDGCATEVVKLADEAGVKLTPAGATFPLGKDPRNRNIRVAPSLPPASQVQTAMEVVALCVKLASARKLAG